MEIRHHINTLIESVNSLLKEGDESIEQQVGVAEQAASKAQRTKDRLIKEKEILQEVDLLCQSDELNSKEKSELKEEVRKLKERVAKLEEELRRKDEKITKLNEKVDRHENKLKEMESFLQVGQIVYRFEKDLAKYVYPGDKKFSSDRIFTKMKIWLEKKKDTPQGRKANERWDALKNEFSWSGEHELVFFKLLESRRAIAHPDLDHNAAPFPIPDIFTDREKECIEGINEMIKRVRTLLDQ